MAFERSAVGRFLSRTWKVIYRKRTINPSGVQLLERNAHCPIELCSEPTMNSLGDSQSKLKYKHVLSWDWCLLGTPSDRLRWISRTNSCCTQPNWNLSVKITCVILLRVTAYSPKPESLGVKLAKRIDSCFYPIMFISSTYN